MSTKNLALKKFLGDNATGTIRIGGRSYVAKPFPLEHELILGEMVIIETGGPLSGISADIGRIVGITKGQIWNSYEVKLVPPQEGGLSYRIGNVMIQRISHHLRPSTKQ